MKYFMILAIVLYAVMGVQCYSTKEEMHEAMKEAIVSCVQKFGISREEFEDTMKAGQTSNPKFSCMQECLMSNLGEFENGEFKFEKYKERMILSFPKLSEAELEETHEKCLPEGHCGLVNSYTICTQEVIFKKEQAQEE